MSQAQKTIVKTTPAAKVKAPAAAKSTAPKAVAAKATPAKTPAAPKAISAAVAAIEMIASRVAKGSAFYARALSYHRDARTSFPRARNAARIAALKIEDVQEVARQHDARILAAGNGNGQACFDLYMASLVK